MRTFTSNNMCHSTQSTAMATATASATANYIRMSTCKNRKINKWMKKKLASCCALNWTINLIDIPGICVCDISFSGICFISKRGKNDYYYYWHMLCCCRLTPIIFGPFSIHFRLIGQLYYLNTHIDVAAVAFLVSNCMFNVWR